MYKEAPQIPKSPGGHHTIKSLRLDLEAAHAGRTWELLPDGWRDRDDAKNYPLPSRRLELQKLVAIYLPHWSKKQDCGCMYIRRAMRKWKKQTQHAQSATLDVAMRQTSIRKSQEKFNEKLKGLRLEAKKAVDEVREEAIRQIASLSDLFTLGRECIEGQMRAHLDGKEWRGETINARAVRECFRMVTAAVKGLGLPSDQRAPAADAVLAEVAASIKSTREVVALAPASETDESRN